MLTAPRHPSAATKGTRGTFQEATLKTHYTVSEAATILGVDPSQVRRYIRDGLLAAIEVNSRLKLVAKKDVERFVRPKLGRPFGRAC